MANSASGGRKRLAPERSERVHRPGSGHASAAPGTFCAPNCSPTTFKLVPRERLRCFVAESERSDDLLQESVPAADAPAITSLLSFQIGAVVIAALYLAREVLVPITAA